MNNRATNPKELSFAQLFELPEFKQQKDDFFSNLRKQCKTEAIFKKEVANLKYDWNFNSRRKQRIPDRDFYIWLIRSGRGFGKTRTGAEWIKYKEETARKAKVKIEMALVGDIYTDIVEAQVKAVLECYAPDDKNKPEFSNQKLTWPSGCVAYLIQAETPKKFRSKNLNCAWVDELAKFMYPQKAWDGLMFAVRATGGIPELKPQVLITTTPATKSKQLLKDIETGKYGPSIVVRGNSYENTALDDRYFDIVLKPYEGTRLGQQEIEGADIDDATGALWNHDMIKYWSHFEEEYEEKVKKLNLLLPNNWQDAYIKENFKHIVVAVDPAVTAKMKSDETGIIVAARDHEGRGFILDDVSGKYTPNQWADLAVKMYRKYLAECIVAEKNQGGDMVASTIFSSDPKVKIQLVHASKGKMVRAEPVARLYEQGRIYHMSGKFTILEDQLCNYTGKKTDKPDTEVEEFNRIDSPDRMDALVWALSYLFSDMIKSPLSGATNFRFFQF